MADQVQTTQYQTGFAPQIAPYAESLLGQAQAYTDVGQNPYQSYTQPRVAQFSPLQQQSYDYANQLQSAPQLQDATALAGQAGLGALNTQYTYQPSNFTADTAKSMMNPYMQNVVDVQKQQAMRDAAIAQQGQQARAANAGAFGGSRDAIMRNQGNAELQRNLQGIQAQGLNNAFTQAQNQYNTQYGQNAAQQQFGAGLGMQGLGIANQSAQNLGALGQTQYGQNVGITGLQNQFGLQQQQQAQNLLNTQYEDFANAQNYPYKQMGFMSDIIRGLPASQTGATMYQPAPSSIQNLASLGLGVAGLSSLFNKADGGMVKSYASGGSVFSPEFKRYAVDHIDPRQLPMAQRNAQARGDMETNQFAMQEMADDAAIRRGIAATFPAGFDVVRAAGGGILAFNGEEDSLVTGTNNQSRVTPENMEDVRDELESDAEEDGAGGNYANQFSREILRQSRALNNLGANDKSMTPEQRVAQLRIFNEALRKQAGTDTGYADFSKRLADMESSSQDRLSEGRGLALLQAIPAMLQGGNAIRGFGNAGAAFAGVYGQYVNAANKEKLSLAQMQYSLADAKRKENLGLTKDAVALMENARRAEMDAKRFAVDKVTAQSRLLGTGARLNKPVKPAAANFDIENRELIAADLKATTPMKKGETPEQYEKRLNAMAAREIYGAKGTKDITSRSNVTSNVKSERDITPEGAEAGAKADTVAAELAKQQENAVAKMKNQRPYLKAEIAKDQDTMDKLEKETRDKVTNSFNKARQAVTSGAKPAALVAQPLPDNPKDPNSYKDGVVYKTSKGNGKWNAATQKFTPVP
jgi:hypothetical protein